MCLGLHLFGGDKQWKPAAEEEEDHAKGGLSNVCAYEGQKRYKNNVKIIDRFDSNWFLVRVLNWSKVQKRVLDWLISGWVEKSWKSWLIAKIVFLFAKKKWNVPNDQIN